ncbi:hypothetical protein [Mycobacterium sp. TY814]|uniref:hypothetical protein n=1 Tax=unclassified Mycobacterium TaxID=2642494 RepID=UPI0027413B02|nr:hypothetical protein [Mycobacterium sp. TY814]MDP7724768.1 hypothetical protein [Mycobacterium sp. TY814]
MTLTRYRHRPPVRSGQQVFAYRNLHRAGWSLRATDGEHAGLVVAHAGEVIIGGARFVVRESGRQRVLREHRKNVHAGVIGGVLFEEDFHPDVRVTYDPYRWGTFVNAETGEPITEAVKVYLDPNGKAWAQGVGY